MFWGLLNVMMSEIMRNFPRRQSWGSVIKETGNISGAIAECWSACFSMYKALGSIPDLRAKERGRGLGRGKNISFTCCFLISSRADYFNKWSVKVMVPPPHENWWVIHQPVFLAEGDAWGLECVSIGTVFALASTKPQVWFPALCEPNEVVQPCNLSSQ